jgi:hypothetical protein
LKLWPRDLRSEDFLKQQNVLHEKLTELAKREAEVYRNPFEKEKELTDRALNLAEVGTKMQLGATRDIGVGRLYLLTILARYDGRVDGFISGAISLRTAVSASKMSFLRPKSAPGFDTSAIKSRTCLGPTPDVQMCQNRT